MHVLRGIRQRQSEISIGQARPQLQATLMQRMTDVLSRMLNDPMTRAALSAGGEDSVDPDENAQRILENREGNSSNGQEDGNNMETDQQGPVEYHSGVEVLAIKSKDGGVASLIIS
ncbi:hypothetical protein NQ317_012398 [Molorchus minor]|uniref:Uncharacterized protein n=1 Tax=Molorchus minor TaxID=1323400 RepID=A0ABQ9JJR2_9CUCU|nr:hypothetical protein NQ317_012398 [Molorchus minor]